MIVPSTLKFLKDLKKHNNKSWFDAHRSEYEDARENFLDFIQLLIDKHSSKDEDLKGLEARKCIFRINRDIRFSKDKSPYKENFAASLDKGGKKSGYAGYYFHLQPGNSFVAAGMWQPKPEWVKMIRQEIDYSFDELQKILKTKKFKTLYPSLFTGEDVQLKKVPPGFEKTNPAAEFLRFKSWMVLKDISDAELVSKSLLSKTLEALTAARPFIKFLNRAVE